MWHHRGLILLGRRTYFFIHFFFKNTRDNKWHHRGHTLDRATPQDFYFGREQVAYEPAVRDMPLVQCLSSEFSSLYFGREQVAYEPAVSDMRVVQCR
jgi:hypothetical protein